MSPRGRLRAPQTFGLGNGSTSLTPDGPFLVHLAQRTLCRSTLFGGFGVLVSARHGRLPWRPQYELEGIKPLSSKFRLRENLGNISLDPGKQGVLKVVVRHRRYQSEGPEGQKAFSSGRPESISMALAIIMASQLEKYNISLFSPKTLLVHLSRADDRG